MHRREPGAGVRFALSSAASRAGSPALARLFWACVLAVLVLMAAPIGNGLPSTGWDKSDHVCTFLVLGLLGLRAYPQRGLSVAAGLVIYGALTEGLQGLLPYRYAEWLDIAADAVGVVLACLLWSLWLRRQARSPVVGPTQARSPAAQAPRGSTSAVPAWSHPSANSTKAP